MGYRGSLPKNDELTGRANWSPLFPHSFVEQETATLRQLRIALAESKVSFFVGISALSTASYATDIKNAAKVLPLGR
jgi:hypothetical protein